MTSKRKGRPHPPKGLSGESRKLWRDTVEHYEIDSNDPDKLFYLKTACECIDRLRAFEAQIEKEGATFIDRYGQPKNHPLISACRDLRNQAVNAMKALKLNDDNEPKARIGRPTVANARIRDRERERQRQLRAV